MNGHYRQPRHASQSHKGGRTPSRRQHMQYRRGIVRRQKIITALTVVGITLLVLLLAMLIIGANLHKKSAALRATDTPEASEPSAPTTPTTPSILAYPWQSRPSSATAASLSLNHPNGTLRCGTDDLALISEEAAEEGIYLSGVFYLSAMNSADDLTRHTHLAENCVQIAELLGAGLNEVVLVLPTDEVRTEDLQEFLKDLRRLVPNAVVGLSLPHSFLTEANAATIDALAKDFSMIATDLSQTDDANEALAGERSYYLRRYAMRVLLPAGDTVDAQLDAVHAHGIENVQIFN